MGHSGTAVLCPTGDTRAPPCFVPRGPCGSRRTLSQGGHSDAAVPCPTGDTRALLPYGSIITAPIYSATGSAGRERIALIRSAHAMGACAGCELTFPAGGAGSSGLSCRANLLFRFFDHAVFDTGSVAVPDRGSHQGTTHPCAFTYRITATDASQWRFDRRRIPTWDTRTPPCLVPRGTFGHSSRTARSSPRRSTALPAVRRRVAWAGETQGRRMHRSERGARCCGSTGSTGLRRPGC